ncbi:XrtA-associated tyrosine autokinase [Herbaspirillum sp. SJZ107]|uniref:XrtA-associated tyrosine autokinase n=1 Tax=Herbaspirillum sp. SJZ107 TaxID=2572881 RepID=UPI0011511982|nr:XrtA-associated tyrosine autokinase [Herbaspirillum sp. SJZ107]TQK05230.1 exopolysaccharide/PEP-CTERM locus tyrosine autokinase [Herbaspirillum sp. SJZ107]
MSIIEKAASRIDQQRSAAATATGTATVPDTDAVRAIPPVAVAAPPAVPPAPAVVMPAAEPVAVPAAAPAQPAKEAERPPQKFSTRRVELDLARMRDLGMVTAAAGRTRLLEDFRVIKRPLLQRAFIERAPGARPNNLIMITSSLPGEGKTYCAINLAMSIAMELDHTVLLVDADVARPSVLRTLGLPAHRGLMDILVDDKLDMADVMLRTNVDTLSILPAGTNTPRATELLASSTMTNLVHEIANRYPDRIVIFDSPPLLLTSESHVLASHMGQIVVMVEAQTTTQHAVKEALQQLEGYPNVNLIYNKTREIPGIEETYDYHYG